MSAIATLNELNTVYLVARDAVELTQDALRNGIKFKKQASIMSGLIRKLHVQAVALQVAEIELDGFLRNI